jgi:uncharacterized membrane protein
MCGGACIVGALSYKDIPLVPYTIDSHHTAVTALQCSADYSMEG